MSYKLLICGIALTICASLFLASSGIVNLPLMVLFLTKVGLVVGIGGTLTFWSLRKVWGEDRADILLINFIILGITIVFLLLVGEFAVRFILRDITTTPNTSYFAERWKRNQVRFNTWGFREREFVLAKADDTYRIAVIGDSFAFGQGIAEKDRFTNLLEENLNTKKNKYEVLNFGRSGAETIDHFAILKDVVLRTDPDFILLQWYVNDFEGGDYGDRPRYIPLLPSVMLHALLHRSSALYYLVRRQWNSLQETLGLSKSYAEYMLQRFGDPEGPGSQEAVRTLKRLIGLCENQEIPLGLVLFPDIGPELGEAYPFGYLHNQVLETCTQAGITCIDLRSTFAPYEYKKLWANRFDSHPGSLANRLAAERLMDTFGRVWLAGTSSE